jgi:hypothetical protein
MDLHQQHGAIDIWKTTNLFENMPEIDKFVDSASAIISIALSGRCHHPTRKTSGHHN